MKKKQKKTDNSEKTVYPDKISSIIKFVATIAGILTAVYPVINIVYNMRYQSRCEEFYHIPGKYFGESVNYRLLYLAGILFMVLLTIYPAILRKNEEKQEKASKMMICLSIIVAALLGILFGIINIYNFVFILEKTNKEGIINGFINNWINNHPYLIIGVLILAGGLAVLGITIKQEVLGLKIKWINRVISLIFIFSLVISVLLMVYAAIFKMNISIEDRLKYEIVTNYPKKYIVLSECDDRVLVVEYEIENEQYVFKTKEYRFLEKYECTYNYIKLNNSPVIETD